MPLRVRITDKTINQDNTLTVAYTLALADATGKEVWSETLANLYPSTVSRDSVLKDIWKTAEQRAALAEASLALDADVGKTYERQPDGRWLALTTATEVTDGRVSAESA